MTTKRKKRRALVLTVLFLFIWHGILLAQSAPTQKTQIVLLGTGTPAPDPERSGPSTAIVVNGTPYLVDFGAGVVRQAAAACKRGVRGLEAVNLRIGFLTHLHSDHTLGYPDLILTPWVVGRRQPLEVYGPKGTAAMTEHLKQAYAADIKVRTEGLEGHDSAGLDVNVHEIAGAGLVYKDANV